MKKVDHYKELMKQIESASKNMDNIMLLSHKSLSSWTITRSLACGCRWEEHQKYALDKNGYEYQIIIIRTITTKKRWAIVVLKEVKDSYYDAWTLETLPILCSTRKEAYSAVDGIVNILEDKK